VIWSKRTDPGPFREPYLRAKSLICGAWVSLRRRAGFAGARGVIRKVRRYQTTRSMAWWSDDPRRTGTIRLGRTTRAVIDQFEAPHREKPLDIDK